MADTINVRVSARGENGFRRAGRFWDANPTDAEVTLEEYKILKAENQLVVLELGEDGNPEGFTGTGDTSALESQVKTLEGEKTKLEADVKKLTDDLEAAKKANTTLESQVKTLEGEKTKLEKDLEKQGKK